MTTDITPPIAPDQPPAARWEDFIDILYAPSLVFRRRRSGGAAIAIVVVTLAIGVIGLVTGESLRPVVEAEIERGMAASAQGGRQLPPEAVERMRNVGVVMTRIGGFIFMPILIVLGGAALWLAAKALGGAQTFAAALMVVAYAHVPRVLEAVINGVQAVVLDPASLDGQLRLSLGPARFLDPDTTAPMVLALLAPFDLFTLWVTVLLAIGLKETAGLSRSRAAIGAALVWVVSALPQIAGALARM